MDDTFVNFWTSWNAQAMLERLREVHPTLDISTLEAEFGRPTGGRPDVTAANEAAETPQETGVEVGDRAIMPIE